MPVPKPTDTEEVGLCQSLRKQNLTPDQSFHLHALLQKTGFARCLTSLKDDITFLCAFNSVLTEQTFCREHFSQCAPSVCL